MRSLLVAHTELQTIRGGPIRVHCHVRDSPTIEKAFISMYDPFSNDDNEPGACASLRCAEKDDKGRNSGCVVWIEDCAGGGASIISRETEEKC